MTSRLAAVCIDFAICVCGSQSLLAQNSSPSPTATPTLEQRVNDLEKRLQAIENIPAIAMMLKLKGSLQADSTPAATPTPQTNAPLELVSWQYQFKPGQYNYERRHLFSYILKNRSDKPIKLVEGTLVFTDLLGEKLMAIRLIPDLKCSTGGTASTSGEWEVNQFEPDQQRLAILSHDDIKATLTVQKVVFSDNTMWSADNGQQ
jgi:hypothetical protein